MLVLDDYMGVTNRVARSISRRYPNVQKDEIRNELFIRVMEEWEWFKDQDPDSTKVWKGLSKRARRAAGFIRRQQLAAHCQYDYRPEDVREMLEHALGPPEGHEGTYVPRDALPKDPVESREQVAIETAADVALAIEHLEDHERALLERRYVKDESLDGPDRARLSRITEKLTQIMNTYKFQR